MSIITYSKNVFIPLSDACNNRCLYCHYRQPLSKCKIMKFEEVKKLLKKAKNLDCTEALFVLGSKTEHIEGFANKLSKETGYNSIYQLLIDCCRFALKIGLLPHSNVGLVSQDILAELAQFNASLGLMLETTAQVKSHQHSPSKEPQKRLNFIALAGKLKIPFTTGLLLGIGENKKERLQSLFSLKELQEKYGHLQELIIQPVKNKKFPPLSRKELKESIIWARKIMPDEVAIQVPPNLENIKDLLELGVSDLGGISPLSIDHINPDYSWPSLELLKKELKPFKLQQRLAVYKQYLNQDWLAENVYQTILREGYLDETQCDPK